jgi:beta-lactamase regulating signal transducer with metallopeptidase domain
MLLLSWVVSNVILALVLALAAWVVQRWLLRPAIAHILWVLVLVKLVTPALVSVPLGQTSDTSACATGTCGCDHHSPTQTFAFDTLPWILLAVWAVGAGTTACIARHRWAHFRRLMTHARPASPEWSRKANTSDSRRHTGNAPLAVVLGVGGGPDVRDPAL